MIRPSLVLLGLQGLDLATTYYGLSLGAMERNAFAAAALEYGFWVLVVAKLAATAIALGIAAYVYRQPGGQPWAKGATAWAGSFMLAIVAWNSWTILLHLG